MTKIRIAIAAIGLAVSFIPLASMPANADSTFTLTLVGQVFFPALSGSDCWGWTAPDGTEYALMGYRNGIGIIRTTPSISLIDTIPGPVGSGGYIWRDIKTYRNYAYAVSEATGTFQGLSVIDLSYLPDSAHYVGSFTTNGDSSGFTSHNLNIDTATGYVYCEGTSSEKVRILSLADPEHPTFVSFFGTSAGSIHDIYARNDTVWVAEGSAGTWSIWDLSDKDTAVMLVRVTIPSAGYVHNVWPSEDGNYCATTEETANKTIKVWDISNLASVQLIGQYLAPSNLAHNTHWIGNRLVNSHYQSGISVVDVSTPTAPTEIARYDTYPSGESPNFNGCWGAFPFTQNGYMYASNIEGTLMVFQLDASCALLSGPGLVSPANGAAGVTQPVTLSWLNNGALSYRIQIDDDPGFGSPAVDSTRTTTNIQVSGLTDETTYYWHVLASNECGEGSYSATRSFSTGCIVAMTGDVDESGAITSADVIYEVNYVFKGGPIPQPVQEAGDVNCSGDVTSADVIYLVNYVFKSGPAPCDVCSIL